MPDTQRIKRIDGLRGLAILLVFFFHLDLKYFAGGFIGVDIFFVISGYVITLYLRNNYLNNTLSLKIFYLNRIRRLIPPLLLVNILVIFLGYFVLSPQLYIDTSWSSLGSIFSFSNIIFWRESNYFDYEAIFKPLLHTWSLSVEEQFYFFWPLLFIFFYKKLRLGNYFFIFFLIIIIFNIIINQIFSNGFTYIKFLKNIFANGEATIFYLLPFRIFEFLIGSFFVFHSYKIKSNFISIISVSIIIFSMFYFKTSSVYPIYTSIFFLIASSILLINDSKFNQILFENKIIIFFGKISYSLYLIHWPFIVFWKYMDLFYTIPFKIIIFLICVLISYLIFEFVEKNLKKVKIDIFAKKFLNFLIAIIFILTLLNFHIIRNDGIPDRLFKKNQILDIDKKFIDDNQDNLKNIWENYTVNSQLFINNSIFGEYGRYARNNVKTIINPNKKTLMIIGDSMAADLFNILINSKYKDQFNLIITSFRCEIIYEELQGCGNEIENLKNEIAGINPEKIFIAYSWQDKEIDNFKYTIPYLKKIFGENKLVFIKSKQQSKWGLNLFSKIFDPDDLNLKYTTQNLSKTADYANKEIKKYLYEDNYFDLTELFCLKGKCRVFDENNYLLIYDYAHLTPKGTKFLAREIEKSIKFQKILKN